jgi:hypothetical protein
MTRIVTVIAMERARGRSRRRRCLAAELGQAGSTTGPGHMNAIHLAPREAQHQPTIDGAHVASAAGTGGSRVSLGGR